MDKCLDNRLTDFNITRYIKQSAKHLPDELNVILEEQTADCNKEIYKCKYMMMLSISNTNHH